MLVHTAVKVAFVAASVIALGGVSTAAYAADPVGLPAGDAIYQANYNSDPTELWTTASDGTATVIGSSTTGVSQVVDGAWNPVTDRSYLIGNGYDGPCELWEVDVTTGAFTFIATITGDDGNTFNCDAFDIGPDGTAWVTMYDGGNSGVLAKLNLTDGTTSEPVVVTGLGNAISWIVIQPSTGVMFLGTFNTDLYTVDPSTGSTTYVETATVEGGTSTYDAAFDSNGRLWVTGWPDFTELYSADVADFAASFVNQGAIEVEGSGGSTGTDSLWIARAPVSAPALAATGLDATVPLAAGLALMILGAAALVVRRTRRA